MRVRFGDFILDTERKDLRRGGTPVRLSPRAFRLLCFLVAQRPRAVSKRDLIDAIWSSSFVEEANLKTLVLEIRKALEERGGDAGVIRTVFGHGYAFAAEAVEEAAAAARQPRVHIEVQNRVILLPEGVHEIGRRPDCAIFIDAASVSRVHARLRVGRDTLVIEDNGSKNGTFVSGERITAPVALARSTRVVCGDVTMVIVRIGDGLADTATADPA